jgi:hypothetical protein
VAATCRTESHSAHQAQHSATHWGQWCLQVTGLGLTQPPGFAWAGLGSQAPHLQSYTRHCSCCCCCLWQCRLRWELCCSHAQVPLYWHLMLSGSDRSQEHLAKQPSISPAPCACAWPSCGWVPTHKKGSSLLLCSTQHTQQQHQHSKHGSTADAQAAAAVGSCRSSNLYTEWTASLHKAAGSVQVHVPSRIERY